MTISAVDDVAWLRAEGMDSVALLEVLGEGRLRAGFAMGQDHAGSGCAQGFEPVEEIGLACVGAEAAEGTDAGFDGDGFAEDGDFLATFDELAAEGPLALVADNDDPRFGSPEVLFEVMENPAGVAHPGSGEDEAGAGEIVEGAGLIGGSGEMEGGDIAERGMVLAQLEGFFVVEFRVGRVEASGLDGHGAVEVDGEGIDGTGLGYYHFPPSLFLVLPMILQYLLQ